MLLLKWLKRTKPTEILNRLKRHLPWRSLTVVLVVAFMISQPVLWPGGFGFSKGECVATKTVESVGKNAQGQITKTVETTKVDDGKTLWDWLSLLGVPLSLAILGYWLQQVQQKRAADETKEEVLQVYFDRLSVLLVDKNLLAIAPERQQNALAQRTTAWSLARKLKDAAKAAATKEKALSEQLDQASKKAKMLDFMETHAPSEISKVAQTALSRSKSKQADLSQ